MCNGFIHLESLYVYYMVKSAYDKTFICILYGKVCMCNLLIHFKCIMYGKVYICIVYIRYACTLSKVYICNVCTM